MSGLSETLQKRLQEDVQRELESREWAEPDDYVMAEYVCVLLANGNPREHVHKEMAELVGGDFDPKFLDWLFAHRDGLVAEATAVSAPAPVEESAGPEAAGPSSNAGSRMFATAVEGTKRKAEGDAEQPVKRRLPDGPLGGAPTGPRSMRDRELMPDRRGDRRDDRDRDRFDRRDGRDGGRSLADRLGPRGMGRGGMNIRGGAPNGRGMNGGNGPMGPGMRPQFGGPGMQGQGGMMMPNQQDMMMQMMAMQANMQQMAQQMAKMSEEQASPRSTPTRGGRPAPAKLPPGTKLGGHAVSSLPPKASVGPIPDKPASTTLCKFGVGCSNARCTYSHPSPAADEKSGMVLSEAACEAGKECKDAECIKSHVSPAAVLGAGAGLSRVLCKYQNCTNPSCQFRHEDADGNFIPPPALSGKTTPAAAASTEPDNIPAPSSDDVEVTFKASMDDALDDTPQERPCRYAERCTRADCKFMHPASRPTPRGGKPATRGRGRPPASGATAPDAIAGAGMTPSRKFAAPAAQSKLNPAAGAFTPAAGAAAEKDLDVSM